MRFQQIRSALSGWNRSVRPLDRMSSLRDLTVIVPTINSARYIDIILDYYRDELDIPVTLFIDSKTVDETPQLAAERAANVIPIQNRATRVGEIIEAMSMACTTPWILRIDDDELPSRAMIEFVARAIRSDHADVYGFSRNQCLVSPGCGLLHDPKSTHIQWRLYRKDRMKYISAGHTPGFQMHGLRTLEAPTDARMIHLDWALHSYDERRNKIARYDSHTANHGSIWRHYYLYEDYPDTRFQALHVPEFDETCRRISQRFPHLIRDAARPSGVRAM